jgi:hypothetical protein
MKDEYDTVVLELYERELTRLIPIFDNAQAKEISIAFIDLLILRELCEKQIEMISQLDKSFNKEIIMQGKVYTSIILDNALIMSGRLI